MQAGMAVGSLKRVMCCLLVLVLLASTESSLGGLRHCEIVVASKQLGAAGACRPYTIPLGHHGKAHLVHPVHRMAPTCTPHGLVHLAHPTANSTSTTKSVHSAGYITNHLHHMSVRFGVASLACPDGSFW